MEAADFVKLSPEIFQLLKIWDKAMFPIFLHIPTKKMTNTPPKKCKSQCVHFGGGMFHFVNSIFSNIAIPAVCTISTAPLLIDLPSILAPLI